MAPTRPRLLLATLRAPLIGFGAWCVLVGGWSARHNRGFGRASALSGRVLEGPLVVVLCIGATAALAAAVAIVVLCGRGSARAGRVGRWLAILYAAAAVAVTWNARLIIRREEGVYAHRSPYARTAGRALWVTAAGAVLCIAVSSHPRLRAWWAADAAATSE